MSFDYRAYLKNNPLLEELPKNQWVDLNKKETEEFSGDIFDLINTAYASIGGNLNYTSADDVTGAQGDANYEVIDIDDDPEIDAVVVSKKKPAGNKMAALGHDGSSFYECCWSSLSMSLRLMMTIAYIVNHCFLQAWQTKVFIIFV